MRPRPDQQEAAPAPWTVERAAMLDCLRRLQLETDELRDLLARHAPAVARLKAERDAAMRAALG